MARIDPIVGGSTPVTAQTWLDAAHGAVRRYCGWHVAPSISETLVLDGDGGSSLLIPSGHVTRLIAVRSDGVDVTTNVDHSRHGILELHGGRWSRRLGGISVELEHGWHLEDVPEVQTLILRLAQRGGAAQGNIASQSVNGAAVSYRAVDIPLLQDEKALLAPYRLGWGQ